MSPLPRLAVLISGEGSNLQALIDAVRDRSLIAEIAVVMSHTPRAPGLERARRAGIPALVHDWRASEGDRAAYDAALAELLDPFRADLVILAGFMRILSTHFLRHYPDRVLNLHPAYLPDDPEAETILLPDGSISPAFRGRAAVADALAAGVSQTGCTVHLVTERVDAGPVLARRAVPILPGDTPETLHRRIQAEEHVLLPETVADYLRRLSFPIPVEE